MAAPEQRTESRQKFCVRKRLNDVIVSPGIETRDAIVNRIASGKDEHRFRESSGSQIRQDLKTVASGQVQIQDHRIERLCRGKLMAFFARTNGGDSIPVLLQNMLKIPPEFVLVFNDKDVRHGAG